MTHRVVVPFKPWHFGWLKESHSETLNGIVVGDDVLRQMQAHNSWTGVVDGEPVACAGTVMQWPGRHTAWAYMCKGSGPHMRWITQEVLKRIVDIKGRIELDVLANFKAGHRWARTLGFRVEAPLMKAYGPAGEDFVGYVRLNDVH